MTADPKGEPSLMIATNTTAIVALVGDHKLLATMGALQANVSWPPAGSPPAGTLSMPMDPKDEAIKTAAHTDLDVDFVLFTSERASMHSTGGLREARPVPAGDSFTVC